MEIFGEVTYTSDVFLGIAFKNAEEMREVLAVYAMDPLVQKLNIMDKWNLRLDGEVPFMFYKEDGVNWSPGPGGWSGVLVDIIKTAGTFFEEREVIYGWYFLRFGERYDDVNEKYGGHEHLSGYLWDRVQFNRSIEVNI